MKSQDVNVGRAQVVALAVTVIDPGLINCGPFGPVTNPLEYVTTKLFAFDVK